MNGVPFLNLAPIHGQIKHEILSEFEAFFDSQWFILGERVKKFEEKYSAFNQVQHTIGVSNGLDALHLALKCLDVGPDDEVIVPSNTFIATVLAVSYTGATPRFVEPDYLTYNISPDKIDQVISSKTKAIIPVHLYGQACDMESIMSIAGSSGLKVIEDNAQAHTASWKGKLAGSWGDINATSFYPGKNLGALGDGGALTTNNTVLADRVRMLRNYGSNQKYLHDTMGFNMRLDECQAAFLSVKLEYLSQWTQDRQKIASWYLDSLKGVGDLVLPSMHQNATHVYHLFVVRSKQRDRLQKFLTENHIGTLIHYPIPPHLQKAYAHLKYKQGDFPIAEELANTSLSLPLWPGMTTNDVGYVIDTIKRFFV